MPRCDANSFEAKKEKALSYYRENGVPKQIEQVLNRMVGDDPKDTYGYLCSYFNQLSAFPTVSKIRCSKRLDSRGELALQIQLYCIKKNNESLCSTVVMPFQSDACEQVKNEENETESMQRQQLLDDACTFALKELNERLNGVDLRNQDHVDDLMTLLLLSTREKQGDDAKDNEEEPAEGDETKSKGKKSGKGGSAKKKGAPAVVIIPDEPKEELPAGFCSISPISKAICEAAAFAKETDVFKHVASLQKCGRQAFAVPAPMITVLQSGKGAPGKNRCVKEYLLIPAPKMSVTDAVLRAKDVCQALGKTIVNKGGPTARNTGDSGAFMVNIDKPEQGLEMIQDALTQCDLKPGEDFFILLNCNAGEFFDYEKGKYEVTQGAMKAPAEMPDFWKDLLTRYPSVIGLIDPLRKEDKEPWMVLCEHISTKCFVIGDRSYHRPGLLKNEELADDFGTNAVVFRLTGMNTVSDVLECSTKMASAGNEVIIATENNDTSDSFLVDLAVGVGARFIKLGGLCRGERVMKYNRLMEIGEILGEQGCLSVSQEEGYSFHAVQLPEAKEEGEIVSALPTPDPGHH